MILINKEPTRADTILNLVIVTSSLNQIYVLLLLPVGGSDNLDQMINLYMVTIADVRHGKIKETQFDLLSGILSSIDWAIAFVVCTDMDGYTAVFVRKLDRALAQSTIVILNLYWKKGSLPGHIIELIQKKNAEWRKEQASRVC